MRTRAATALFLFGAGLPSQCDLQWQAQNGIGGVDGQVFAAVEWIRTALVRASR